MLSSVLRTKQASEVSVSIMRAFVAMKTFLNNNAHISQRLSHAEVKLLEHDNHFKKIFGVIEHKDLLKEKIFFDGQIYDAHSVLLDYNY
jgi:hypothetical protein